MSKNKYLHNLIALTLIALWQIGQITVAGAQRFSFAAIGDAPYSLPGDNEWTDCHRADNGGFDPIERLAKLREQFFANPAQSLGREKIALEHQDVFVENRRRERTGVVFATLHIVGSNNNLQRDQAAVNEYVARNAANLAWMQATFAGAKSRNAKAVVLAFQADPRWEHDGREDLRAGFTDTLAALRQHARAFGKPVLVIHGDKHLFIIDKPLYQNRQLIYNVTRLMVFGAAEVQGVMVNVDADDPDVFSSEYSPCRKIFPRRSRNPSLSAAYKNPDHSGCCRNTISSGIESRPSTALRCGKQVACKERSVLQG